MIVKQLSVFLENKQGRLCAATDVLAKAGINISALSLADTAEFGILRLIVDRPDEARRVLIEEGIVVRVSNVIAVAMNDTPGGALDILHCLATANINVEYLYASVGRSGKAIMIVRVDDDENAEKVLHDGGFHDVHPSEIYRI
jgi:hypothetical protein